MSVDLVVGPGSIHALPAVAARCSLQPRAGARTAVVIGGGFDDRPWAADVRRAVGELRPAWITHQGEVRPAGVAALARQLRDCHAEVVVAVGGGSVLDAAKAAVTLTGGVELDAAAVTAACTGRATPPPTPVRLVAVPTTAGTGAEVTPFATVWQRDPHRKLSLGTAPPAAALLDPDLLGGLTAAQCAAGLLDTLCQGAEAAWSLRATAESTAYGLAAVTLAGSLLERLGAGPPDAAVRMVLQSAGHLSGRAIALAPTTVVHALSYPLTLHAGLAHGHACGVTFGRILRFNAAVTDDDCADPRGPDRVRDVVARIVAALGASDAPDADKRIEAFLDRHGLATLDRIPYSPEHLAREALAYPRSADNPRRLDLPGLTRWLASRRDAEEPCR
ncbi:iron-containing alcohol dehydrogenase [Solwaraspora sp. WMMD1047]|uniref:iron-containing alcohol dehydrogenase n=1 Tax=Solwaraspora sp. WMMD1047 TaxID=3016102 RepID=UPI002417CD94|nr:iron-containing alcohol dehydrogenase [Solwaraspora sp. WMMD1047]MDG4834267.1 iron-containing alcohol dehydrogenase [Solwaraspora sp. WMMD1047]